MMESLIIGFILIVASSVASFLKEHHDYINGDTKSRMYWWVFFIALIGALFTTYSGYELYNKEQVSSAKADSLNTILIESQRLNTQLLLEQKDSTNKIISINNELIKINFNIQSLQNIVAKNLTGDGNIPHLLITPSTFSRDNKGLNLRITNNGKTPIRGVKVTVQDFYSDVIAIKEIDTVSHTFEKSIEMYAPPTFDNLHRLYNKELFIGDIPPGTFEDFYRPQIPINLKDFSLSIKIQWDGGYYYCDFEGVIIKNKMFPNLKIKAVRNHSGEIKEQKFIQVFNMPD